MKHVLVIGSEKNWHVQDLRRASEGLCYLSTTTFGSLRSSIRVPGYPPIEACGGHAKSVSPDCIVVRRMPLGSLEQIIFRMNALSVWNEIGTTVVNPPRSLEIAIDKYLCLATLNSAGLPTPKTITCQGFDEAMEAYHLLGEDVVVKPLFGGEGRSLIRVDHSDLAERTFRLLEQHESIIYLQEFIGSSRVVEDIRLLVIGNEVLAMRRENGTDWRANAARGATCSAYVPSSEEVDLALNAARAIGGLFVGVDLIRDQEGKPFLLEVNGVPGWKKISQVHNVDVATRFLELVVKSQFAEANEALKPSVGTS